MNNDVNEDLEEVNRITSAWIVDDRATRFPKPPPTRSYVSKVPAALNCLNRAAKEALAPQVLYELKYQVMLICARLGWARECADGNGYMVGEYRFHLPWPPLDCSLGDETRHRNLDRGRIDDLEEAVSILERFVEAFPRTTEEEELLEDYRENQEQERAEYEERCQIRSLTWGEFEEEGDEEDEEDDDLDDVDFTIFEEGDDLLGPAERE